MADNIENLNDDDPENAVTEEEAIPTSNEPPQPEDDTQEDNIQSPPEEQISGYQNPMANAPRPGPNRLLSNIIDYALEKFPSFKRTAPQGAIPTSEDTTETPGELGLEAKQYIQKGKEATTEIGNQIAGNARDIENTRPVDIWNQAAKVPGQIKDLAKNTYSALTPPSVEGSIAEQGRQAETGNDFRPGDYAQDYPEELKKGQGAASPSTVAAITHAVDPNGQKTPNMSLMEAIKYAQDHAGMDGGLGILQAARKNYDISRAFGAVALDHNNISSAIDAATRAYKSMPNEYGVTFTHGPNNSVSATVLDPVTHSADTYLIPFNKFGQLLKGMDGDFDNVLNRGVLDTIESLGRKVEPIRVRAEGFVRTRAEILKEQESSDAAQRAEDLERVKGGQKVREQQAKSQGYFAWHAAKNQADLEAAMIKARGAPDELRKLILNAIQTGKTPREMDQTIQRYKQYLGGGGQQGAQPTQQTGQPRLVKDNTGRVWQINPDGTRKLYGTLGGQ